MSETEPGILSRWSQRKLQAKQQEVVADAGLAQASMTSGQAPDQALVEPEEAQVVLTDADMPPLDSLDESSDYSGFMSPGVSDALRKMALKKLFHAPVFNLRDGLDEYDEDFTRFEALGDIVTSDMRHQLEVEAQKKLQQELAPQADAGADSEEEAGAIEVADTKSALPGQPVTENSGEADARPADEAASPAVIRKPLHNVEPQA